MRRGAWPDATVAQQDEMTRLGSVWDGMPVEQRTQQVLDSGVTVPNRDGRSPAARIAAQPWSSLTDQQREKLSWRLPDPAAPAPTETRQVTSEISNNLAPQENTNPITLRPPTARRRQGTSVDVEEGRDELRQAKGQAAL
jgi:hypothetical protein